ncbi:cysteine-rich CWC family protein [Azohydromonas caseinilytica]|uniref:Cysteine-rich CWC family protein n=1 Tax=Azohydromonas caseinilytica TaxID=2728836 RepID=A0A848F590_9BURK|nr:cysteine-rich CWC family protein [Azohydromonas caseinilytica]NML15217.1 cysteine-rich CWC family protein [Azohydromonas caseinilytica]
MSDAANVKPLDDRCPRCGGGFHCGVNDAGPCPCTTVTLSTELQGRLREKWSSCLCVSCLVALAGGAALEIQEAQAQ